MARPRPRRPSRSNGGVVRSAPPSKSSLAAAAKSSGTARAATKSGHGYQVRPPRPSPARRPSRRRRGTAATAKVPASKASTADQHGQIRRQRRGQAEFQRRGGQTGFQRRGEQRYGQLLGDRERRAGAARVRQEEAGAGGSARGSRDQGRPAAAGPAGAQLSVPAVLAVRARGERLWGIVPVRGSARW